MLSDQCRPSNNAGWRFFMAGWVLPGSVSLGSLLALAIFLLPLQNALLAETPTRLSVFASIQPQKFFLEQLAGELADVEVMVGPDMSPHTYEPLPQQMSKLSRARLFFTIGVPFEKALAKRLADVCPDLKIVDTTRGIAYQTMESYNHQHSETCSHGAGQLDPHVWLDPDQVMIQAQNITAALQEAMPVASATFAARLASFSAQLQSLSGELSATLAPVKGQTMLVFHPAFGYFARRFGLRQQAIEIEGKEPGPRQLVELIRKCRSEKIHIIFVQKQFPVVAAQTIATAIEGAVVIIDPLAEDYFANLRQIATTVASALQKP